MGLESSGAGRQPPFSVTIQYKGSNVIYCIDRCLDRADHITSLFSGAGVWLYVVYLFV